MVRVYRISPSRGECQDVIPVNRKLLMPLYRCTRSLAADSSFGVIEFERDPDSEPRGPSDMFSMTRTAMIVSDLAYRTLSTVLDARSVSWMPATFERNRIWVIHVLRVVDAVDEAESVMQRAVSGEVVAVDRLFLKQSSIGDSNVFRLGAGLESWHPCVKEDVLHAVRRDKLTGFSFCEVKCY